MNRKTLIALAAALCMAPGAHAAKDQIERLSYSFGAVAQPDSSPSPARQTTIVQDVGATRPAPTPPTPIGDMTQGTAGTQGLLLPAVQKVREAAAPAAAPTRVAPAFPAVAPVGRR